MSRSGCSGWTDAVFPCWTSMAIRNRTQSSSAGRRGCFLLCMRLPTGAAAGSAPTPGDGNSAISMTTTRICGPGCWNCRPCRERSLRSLTGPRHFRKLTQVFGVKMNNSAYGKTPHSGEGRFHAKSYHKFDLIWRSAGAGRRFPSNAAGSAPEGWCLREHRF